MNIRTTTYDEIRDLSNHPEKYLIDVREAKEIEETGKIPSSINIPLGNVISELDLEADPVEFENKYGLSKPTLDSYIIFYCRSGRRSYMAAKYLVEIGYKNINDYKGSWLNWIEREATNIVEE